MPIIVGGTNYYLETLLFEFNVQGKQSLEEQKANKLSKVNETLISEEEMKQNWEEMKAIDPVITNKFHFRDFRKIRNYLNYYH